jgi:hypothetical protein
MGDGVFDGVLNILVAQVVLKQPRVGTLVGQSKAAGVAQHVRVGLHGQARTPAARTDRNSCRLAAERSTPLADQQFSEKDKTQYSS